MGFAPDVVAMSHAMADLEQERTAAVRRMAYAKRLIRDARSALAAGDLDVVAEFLERAEADLTVRVATDGE